MSEESSIDRSEEGIVPESTNLDLAQTLIGNGIPDRKSDKGS